MEPHRRPSGRRSVLLPYEIDLCESLGITADEYWEFIAVAEDYVKQRPEEYAHIPDIRNEPVTLTTIAINLVVGVALTAAAALLAPKPKAPEQDERRGPLEIGGQTGRSRYTKASNFDSVQSLAKLGETIPLIFADRNHVPGRPDLSYGGIRVNSQLLHSQFVASGTTQVLWTVLMFGAGKLGVNEGVKPDYEGFAVGDLLLRDFSPYKNNLYFRVNGDRFRDVDGIKYPEGKLTVDEKDADLFGVYDPVEKKWLSDFSGARTPSATTQFGAYNPMPNGHRFLTPYQLAMVPKNVEDEAEAKERGNDMRRKMSRAFPRMAGITSADTNVDGTVNYRVVGRTPDNSDTFDVIECTDIDLTQEETRQFVDETIQEGQEFLLGTARGICISRDNHRYYPESKQDVNYQFTITEAGYIPVVGDSQAISNATRKDKGGAAPWSRACIQQISLGRVANSSPCDVTEIGIRSEVWRRMQGAANFNEHPEFDTIEVYEDAGDSISIGQVTKYMKRFSFFYLEMRPFNAPDWQRLSPIPFAVRGASPEYIFNTLHIRHAKGQHEFQFVPVPGAQFYGNFAGNANGLDVFLLEGTPLNRADNNHVSFGGYDVYYTGTATTLSEQDVTNCEWVFGGCVRDNRPITERDGPIRTLQDMSNGVPIPTAIGKELVEHDYQSAGTGGNKTMVTQDPDDLTYSFFWRGETIVTGHANPGYKVPGVETRYEAYPTTREPVRETIPSGWGSRETSDPEIDWLTPRYEYGVVESGGTYYYYWDGTLVHTTTVNTAGFVEVGTVTRYERIGGMIAGGTSWNDIEGQTDLFDPNPPSATLENPTTGCVLKSDGLYHFYRNGTYKGSSTDKFWVTEGGERRYAANLSKGVVREGKAADPYGEFIRSDRAVRCGQTIVYDDGPWPCWRDGVGKTMWDGAVLVSAETAGTTTDQFWLYREGTRIARWPANQYQGTVTGYQNKNGNYKIDVASGPLRMIDDPNPGMGSWNVWKLEKYRETPAIDPMYTIDFQQKVVTENHWGIAKETFSEGVSGRWAIAQYKTGVVTDVEPSYSEADVVGDDGNRSARVVLRTYVDPDGGATAYRWGWGTQTTNAGTFRGNRGDNYKIGEQVRIGGTGFNTTVLDIGSISDITGDDEGNKNYEDFISPGTNYSPLNAICDYFINNTDTSSHENSPEHSIIFCNEIVWQDDKHGSRSEGETVPKYDRLAMAGLKLLNARDWTSFNSFSAYIKRGHEVERLFARTEPSRAKDGRGATNLFPEIAYHLLTDNEFGAGRLIGKGSVDRESMKIAAQFCKANNFYWDGIIADNQNIRSFIFENAAFMLLDFTIKGGKFGLYPSVPFVDGTYEADFDQEPEVKALFTDGNMRNMEVSFLTPEERQPFIGVALYRDEKDNGFPETRSISVRLADDEGGSSADPIEEFDMTGFCTSRQHAKTFLKYALKLRKLVDHSIKFETTPQSAMTLEPGDYFRVASHVAHTDRFKSGSIDIKGVIQSADEFLPGTSVEVVYWRPNIEGRDVQQGTMVINSQGLVENTLLHGTVFTRVVSSQNTRLYKCESLTYSEDGLVEIAGSHAPLKNKKLAVLDWKDDDRDFAIEDY